jgi:hypothetical protein
MNVHFIGLICIEYGILNYSATQFIHNGRNLGLVREHYPRERFVVVDLAVLIKIK